MYKTRHAWFFLTVPLILLSVFTFIPAIAAFILSFTNYNVFQPIEFIGIQNYIDVLSDHSFRNALSNTVYFWILVTPALIIFPIFLAILVNQKLKGISVFRLIYYFPVLVSIVVTAILWRWMFAESGIFNYVLSLVGIDPIRWLTSTKTVMPAMAIVTVWQGLGYYMLFFLAALQGVPKELYEAADIDGANFVKKHVYITIPLIKPMIFFVAVISTMSAFKEFTLMLTMTSGGPLNASTTVVLLVFKEAFERVNMGYASAISFVLFVVILIITIINKKFLDTDYK
ncbi:lactose ABC transporter permease [Halolactibacillus alkaliphilus]|uniref:Lactose ABC transporter permease n=1 Tax=Halolactibacillus alkaliphilus TaxID=442899 RepID=A0A511WZP6_9BACI|nr:sugar ABC transporter permease [Halolactibacillus alkaliphilus]GEN56162.1 lactose ABC transporter permease [Halolactibacillus alkaliphilus]GGN66813.1 lactose ABC transporter permease [Halolactibacillus alkaliphilus]SFO72083.1 putative chitobiose transport system permease protein [Halolactibacillus alkaliphilus]